MFLSPDIFQWFSSSEDEGLCVFDLQLHQSQVELRAEVIDADVTPEKIWFTSYNKNNSDMGFLNFLAQWSLIYIFVQELIKKF